MGREGIEPPSRRLKAFRSSPELPAQTVTPEGLEPPTPRLKAERSTIDLRSHRTEDGIRTHVFTPLQGVALPLGHFGHAFLMGGTGFEPVTPRTSSECSPTELTALNLLSFRLDPLMSK